MTIREQEIPTCPGCGKSDRVEYHGKGAKYATTQASESPLRDWWCSRCHGWLSALPALPAPGRAAAAPGGTTPVKIGERVFDTVEPQPTGVKPKRGKPKEAEGNG